MHEIMQGILYGLGFTIAGLGISLFLGFGFLFWTERQEKKKSQEDPPARPRRAEKAPDPESGIRTEVRVPIIESDLPPPMEIMSMSREELRLRLLRKAFELDLWLRAAHLRDLPHQVSLAKGPSGASRVQISTRGPTGKVESWPPSTEEIDRSLKVLKETKQRREEK